jgi:hypothetical protein
MQQSCAKPRKVARREMGQAARNAASDREYFDLGALTTYGGLCRRTLWSLVSDQADPLPASKIRGKWLVRRRDFDAYVERHQNIPSRKILAPQKRA